MLAISVWSYPVNPSRRVDVCIAKRAKADSIERPGYGGGGVEDVHHFAAAIFGAPENRTITGDVEHIVGRHTNVIKSGADALNLGDRPQRSRAIDGINVAACSIGYIGAILRI